jgi:hypothetical protein
MTERATTARVLRDRWSGYYLFLVGSDSGRSTRPTLPGSRHRNAWPRHLCIHLNNPSETEQLNAV